VNSEASGQKLVDDVLVEDGLNIATKGKTSGIIIRLLGAVAIRIHTTKMKELYPRLRRLGTDRQFTDLDFIAYGKQRTGVHRLFTKELGYIVDKPFMAYFGENRFRYHHPKNLYDVDVFFDKLVFSHDLFLGSSPEKGRLELDFPTIPLADLVLEKLQIHELNEKDVKDLVVLFREHDTAVGEEQETINLDRIAKVLGNDWGLWYDGKTNLAKTLSFAEKYTAQGLLTKEDLEDVTRKVNRVLESIELEPKTKDWQRRAKTGTAKRWWREVEELVR